RNLAQRKHTPPARPVLRTGFAEPAGIFRRGILPLRKTPHIHVRRPAGFIRRLRRYGGAPEVKTRSKGNIKGNSANAGVCLNVGFPAAAHDCFPNSSSLVRTGGAA